MNPNPDPAKHAEIPIWNAENWMYEDLVVGERIRSIRRTISEGESMQFNALVLDMHPYVGDEIFAREQGVFRPSCASLARDLWSTDAAYQLFEQLRPLSFPRKADSPHDHQGTRG